MPFNETYVNYLIHNMFYTLFQTFPNITEWYEKKAKYGKIFLTLIDTLEIKE